MIMTFSRRSGILLHPTSLPGTPGIGTLGAQAYAFVDWLAQARQTLWQILPLGPTGYGDSPYASFSTFAGNPLLIDLDLLVQNDRAEPDSVRPPEYIRTSGTIDYGAVVSWKLPVLQRAARWFLSHGSSSDLAAFEKFKKQQDFWLSDYASFMSIKTHYDAEAARQGVGGIWHSFWPKELAACNTGAVSAWNKAHADDIESLKAIQYFFFDQWHMLKAYANRRGISIIGDIPIFVAPDSADVWSNQELFQVDEHGTPLAVAGVPPDYFSATGQLWGNPLYDWGAMQKDDYRWWVRRISHTLTMVDCIRIDHFRGFESYWSVPYGNDTAVNGEWKPGPGRQLFDTVSRVLGDIPIIAEDLGVITEQVRQLRDGCGFPGMKVLQFAFNADEPVASAMENQFLPHEYTPDCVVYTGTHDNQTMQGFLESAPQKLRVLIASYLCRRNISAEQADAMVQDKSMCRMLVQEAIASTAKLAVIPVQDILAVGDEGRMNMPSTSGTNWTWRLAADALTPQAAQELAFTSGLFARNKQINQRQDFHTEEAACR